MQDPLNILTHYLRLACKGVGVNWTRNNDCELERIVDQVRAVARAEVAGELDELRDRIAALEQRLTPPAA
ncbi:hypothetical protein ABZ297_28050 [Nonomuraea sp. NPDC005983]|uniref:hypothetical protein n=1 Tax=Nonomuraea sp. NPDC005983 TaxID=3155595 RepID=UPI0033BD7C10